jgi:flavin-dependent dehydrogenase
MEKNLQKRDIVIIGGGPSGISTALHLAQNSPELIPRILVLEKAHYPRPKLCAGGLVVDAEVILQRLGLDVSEVPHVDADAAHFDFAGQGLTVSLPKRHTLRIIRRDEFDAWLAEKATAKGIEIRQGVTVVSVRPDSDGVTIETESETYRAQVVIGADGSNGIVRRSILPNTPVYTARVLEVITPPHQSPTTSLKRGKNREKAAYFDFFAVPQGIAGYTWDFPTQVKGQPMRCWGIYDTNILADMQRPALKAPLADEMARFGFNLGDYELKGHPIRWFDPFNTFSVPRVLLAGDAVGADPALGEGISMALGYGKVAAAEVAEAFKRGDFGFKGYKRRVMLSPLGQALLARWFLAYIMYPLRWKWFQFLLWRILQPVVLLIAWLFVLNWAERMH